MSELPYIADAETLKLELRRLIAAREAGKLPRPRGRSLTRAERVAVHAKTDGRCHVCGELVPVDGFEADHVKNHTSGGECVAGNYLPACTICNGYRWHYIPHEFQWIMKLGIWAKTQIDLETTVGESIAKGFVAHERGREKRRKSPRVPMSTFTGAAGSEDIGFETVADDGPSTMEA